MQRSRSTSEFWIWVRGFEGTDKRLSRFLGISSVGASVFGYGFLVVGGIEVEVGKARGGENVGVFLSSFPVSLFLSRP